MEPRRETRDARAAARRRKKRNAILRPFVVLLCLSAIFAAIRLVSKPYDHQRPPVGVDSGSSFFAAINPWDEGRAETTDTYLTGAGVLYDPEAPKAEVVFAIAQNDASEGGKSSEDQNAPRNLGYFMNAGETTEQGAEFAELALPSEDQSVAESALNWGGTTSALWKQETDLSFFHNLSAPEFQEIASFAGGLPGKTLVVDGKPTYQPDPYFTEIDVANAAKASREVVMKVARSDDSERKKEESPQSRRVSEPEMRPAEDLQPGVAFIPTGYRRLGQARTHGTGTIGQVSTSVD
ncbi:MAG: hypothetical protein ACOX0A_10950 [Thermoguttaceae bacterium]|jgi:hypothetical protein